MKVDSSTSVEITLVMNEDEAFLLYAFTRYYGEIYATATGTKLYTNESSFMVNMYEKLKSELENHRDDLYVAPPKFVQHPRPPVTRKNEDAIVDNPATPDRF